MRARSAGLPRPCCGAVSQKWNGLPTVPLLRPKVSWRVGETFGRPFRRGQETRAERVGCAIIVFAALRLAVMLKKRAGFCAVFKASHINDGLRKSIFRIATVVQRAALHSARD